MVYVWSAQGQRLAVQNAKADSEATSVGTLGMVTETIANNQEGFITTSGLVRGINTTGSLQGETWSDGDVLYLSAATAGKITKTKPTAPNHVVTIGYVVHAHATQGVIYIKVDNGYELGELHDVNTTLSKATPVDADALLLQDSADSSIWKKLTWANVKAALKTYFDALYQAKLSRFVSTTDGTAISSTTTIGITSSQLIPANTFAVGNVIRMRVRFVKATANASTNFYVYVNTTNSLSGATQIALLQSNNRFNGFKRDLMIKSTTITQSFLTNTSAITDDVVNSPSAATTNIDWTQDQYIIFAVGHSGTTDTGGLTSGFTIEKF
jgi:hypothetical protein